MLAVMMAAFIIVVLGQANNFRWHNGIAFVIAQSYHVCIAFIISVCIALHSCILLLLYFIYPGYIC